MVLVLHFVRIPLNWAVHNMLHPEANVKFGLNHPGMMFQKDGFKTANERNLMYLYCNAILFWVRLPKKQSGKIMAWSVLGCTLLQALLVFIQVKYVNP